MMTFIAILSEIASLAAKSAHFILLAGCVILLVIMFKPLLKGLWRATALTVKRIFQRYMKYRQLKLNERELQRLYQTVNELEIHSPTMAAEIRAMSTRI